MPFHGLNELPFADDATAHQPEAGVETAPNPRHASDQQRTREAEPAVTLKKPDDSIHPPEREQSPTNCADVTRAYKEALPHPPPKNIDPLDPAVKPKRSIRNQLG